MSSIRAGVLLVSFSAAALIGSGCWGDEFDCHYKEIDHAEPNDTLETASTLYPNTEERHTIHCDEDGFNDDYLRLRTEARHVYGPLTIEVESGERPQLQLIDPDGNEIDTFLERDGDGGAWLGPEQGAYRVRLSAAIVKPLFARYSETHGGSFTVKFEELEGDEYEPDDTPTSAPVIPFGLLQTHTLLYYADVDMARFDLDANQRIQVFVPHDQLDWDITPIVMILDEAGNEVSAGAPDWNRGSPGPGQCCAGGFWEAPTAGTYYVRFAHDQTVRHFIGPRSYALEVSLQ